MMYDVYASVYLFGVYLFLIHNTGTIEENTKG